MVRTHTNSAPAHAHPFNSLLSKVPRAAFVMGFALASLLSVSAQSYKDSLYHLGPQDRSQRLLYSVENQFPNVGQYELGVQALFGEYNDFGTGLLPNEQDNIVVAAMPQIRYAPFEDSFVFIKALGAINDPEGEANNVNLGAEIGGAVKVYEDICKHPYIIPHASIGLRAGDEDDFRYLGESFAKFGVSFGEVVWSRWHMIADLSYDVRTETANRLMLSGSTIWEFSHDVGLIGEFSFSDQDDEDDERWDDDSVGLHVGGYWDYNEDLRVSAFFGSGYQGLDTFGMFQANYQVPLADRETRGKIDSFLGRDGVPSEYAPGTTRNIENLPIIEGEPIPQPSYPQPAPFQAPPVPQPSFSQPSIAPPMVSEPVYSQPSFSQPSFSQPSFSQPVYSQPSFSQPVPFDGGGVIIQPGPSYSTGGGFDGGAPMLDPQFYEVIR